MLTVTEHDPQGYPINVEWFCDACEPIVLAERGVGTLQPYIPHVTREGKGTARYTTSRAIPTWCMRCEDHRRFGDGLVAQPVGE